MTLKKNNLLENKKNNSITGYQIAIIYMYFYSYLISELQYLFKLNYVIFYWLSFTILNCCGSIYYIKNKKNIRSYSDYLLSKKKHVWNQKYYLKILLPSNFLKIFYSEYAAYADREYKRVHNYSSQLIDVHNSILCSLFAIFAIYNIYKEQLKNFYISITISMCLQLMRNIQYMCYYNIQKNNKNSINYDTNDFPCGKYLIKRPFIYINLLSIIMPIYILLLIFD